MLIYKILFPNGKSYIGQTQRQLKQRQHQYKSCYKKRNDLVYKSIRKYGWDNIRWEILEDNIQDLKLLNERETFYILKYDSFMPNGYNMTFGGDGSVGHIFTEEQKKNMSIAQKGHKGTPLTNEQKEYLRKINTGRKHTDETKKKMSESGKRKIISKEQREKMRVSRIGLKRTDETKKKMSEIRKTMTLTEETKKKISQSHMGKKLSDEHKNKISSWYYTLSPEEKEKFKIKRINNISIEEKECEICQKKFMGTPVAKVCSDECKKVKAKEYMKEYFLKRKS